MATQIDRIAPTVQPAGRASMYQTWSQLLFLHWALPAHVLRPLIPDGLDVDTFEGNAYVGLVPFTMFGIRCTWAPPIPGTSRFHEVNVRTYVHREGRDPGVWFLSLDAASPLAVLVARRAWSLPYHRARMSLREADGGLIYRSERIWPGPTPAGCDVAYRPEGTPSVAAPGSLEHFLAERYILYALHRGKLHLGRVHHSPYPIQPARLERLQEDLLAAAGIERPGGVEPLAHFARGVRVRVYPLRKTS